MPFNYSFSSSRVVVVGEKSARRQDNGKVNCKKEEGEKARGSSPCFSFLAVNDFLKKLECALKGVSLENFREPTRGKIGKRDWSENGERSGVS